MKVFILMVILAGCASKFNYENRVYRFADRWLDKNRTYLNSLGVNLVKIEKINYPEVAPSVVFIDDKDMRWKLDLQEVCHNNNCYNYDYNEVNKQIKQQNYFLRYEVLFLKGEDFHELPDYAQTWEDRMFFKSRKLQKGVSRAAVKMFYSCDMKGEKCAFGQGVARFQYKSDKLVAWEFK